MSSPANIEAFSLDSISKPDPKHDREPATAHTREDLGVVPEFPELLKHGRAIVLGLSRQKACRRWNSGSNGEPTEPLRTGGEIDQYTADLERLFDSNLCQTVTLRRS